MQLLLEPMWNWNPDSLPGQTFICHSPYELLLEPMWNWNLTALLYSLSRLASTRTNVELKLVWRKDNPRSLVRLLLEPMWNWNRPVALLMKWAISAFYSNQCGIETVLTNSRRRLKLCNFYSNQCGIETTITTMMRKAATCLLLEPMWNWNPCFDDLPMGKFLVFYSNQCGIETRVNKHFAPLEFLPSTRTNVELKLSQATQAAVPRCLWLLLEPMWNWNQFIGRFRPDASSASTRTNVELKPEFVWKRFAEGKRLLLEPMWNWNRKRRRHSQRGWTSTSTRTNVELKQTNAEIVTQTSKLLLLEPMWNWNPNRVELMGRIWYYFYSNQCGIETRNADSSPCLVFAAFYSNQCGIETISNAESPVPLPNTSTRTNVELKLSEGRLSHIEKYLLLEPMWNWNS